MTLANKSNQGKRYLVYSGYLRSEMDSARHFVGFGDLIRLYGVDPRRCIDMTRRSNYCGLNTEDERYVHLFPQQYGDYTLTEEERAT